MNRSWEVALKGQLRPQGHWPPLTAQAMALPALPGQPEWERRLSRFSSRRASRASWATRSSTAGPPALRSAAEETVSEEAAPAPSPQPPHCSGHHSYPSTARAVWTSVQSQHHNRAPGSPSSSPRQHPSCQTPSSGYPHHPRPGPRPSSCVPGPRTAPPRPPADAPCPKVDSPCSGSGRWHWTNSQPHHLPSLNLTAMTAKRGSRDSARRAQWDQGGNAQDLLGAGWTPELYLLPFPLPTVCEAGPASGPWCPSASDRAAVSLRRHPQISEC